MLGRIGARSAVVQLGADIHEDVLVLVNALWLLSWRITVPAMLAQRVGRGSCIHPINVPIYFQHPIG